ncbi:MAG: histidine phosphatase family protein [Dehalococcoidia bacterium]
MPANSIILVRHAESEHHIKKLSGGWTDTPITELGHQQAHLVAQRLKGELGETPIRLIASDLLRTQNTARHIADAFGVEPVLDRRLREFNNGEAAGLTNEEVARRWPRPPGPMGIDERPWPGCETWREFYARAGAFLDALELDGPTPVLVTHGGTVFVLVAHWLGLAPEHMKVVNFGAHVTSVTVLRTWNGLREVERLNDASHLAGTGGWVGLGAV